MYLTPYYILKNQRLVRYDFDIMLALYSERENSQTKGMGNGVTWVRLYR